MKLFKRKLVLPTLAELDSDYQQLKQSLSWELLMHYCETKRMQCLLELKSDVGQSRKKEIRILLQACEDEIRWLVSNSR